ncbi:MAG: AMP-binding protein [Lachnospiraceae bacterium]|nr:AMP-binding protein [Lachnospiraceae bacterium]
MEYDKKKAPWLKYYDEKKRFLKYPDVSVYTFLKEAADRHPKEISYEYFGRKKRYWQFMEEIDECAKAFLALGVNPRECVSICMPNVPEAIIAFYAINKIGAIANMIHPLSAEKEIEYYLNVSHSTYVVAIDIAVNKINHVCKRSGIKKCIVVSVKDSMPLPMKVGYMLTKGRKVKVESSDILMPWRMFLQGGKGYDQPINSDYRGSDVAAILYSGGTSGYPKGIELTNLNFNALALQSEAACGCLSQGDRVLSIMPVFHGFGLGICIHTVQYFGGTCILLPQFSAQTFHKLLMKYRPNIIAGVPTLYEALLKNRKLDGCDLSFLKCVISGGDSLSVSLKHKVDAFLHAHGAPIQIREGYGLTECVTGSCLTPINDYREGSIGIPYPDTYYKIVKPGTEEELPYGEEGEIVLSGPSVMKGYQEDEKETAATLRKHVDGLTWMYTGDMGKMDEDGFVYFKQRIKRMIISSGYCLYPSYMENIIDSHPKVLMSCVIGIAHPYKVQVAKAFIVLRNGYEPDKEVQEEIKAYCEENLARFAWPYEYEFRKELPKTLVGKVAYSKLQEEERKKNGEN